MTQTTGWPLWEVFVRSRQGLDHKHCGSLHASDATMALQMARDVYTRRLEGVSIWVVPSAAITAAAPADLAWKGGIFGHCREVQRLLGAAVEEEAARRRQGDNVVRAALEGDLASDPGEGDMRHDDLSTTCRSCDIRPCAARLITPPCAVSRRPA